MSQEQPMPHNAIASRPKMPIRLNQVKRVSALNIIGLPELIGLAGAALLALIAVFAYFYFYLPANSRLSSTELERQRLQGQRQALGTALQENMTTRERVDRIKTSLVDFEGNWLPVQSSGRMTLYTVLNNLIRSNGLRNTSGPTYSPLEPVGTKTQVQPSVTAEKQTQAKWQTIYPGIAVSVTVEGPYQNVRHFVRDIETSRQFLIVNAVELERVTQSGADQSAAVESTIRGTPSTATRPLAGGRGTLVSLRMDMATYFQRSESAAPVQ